MCVRTVHQRETRWLSPKQQIIDIGSMRTRCFFDMFSLQPIPQRRQTDGDIVHLALHSTSQGSNFAVKSTSNSLSITAYFQMS